jgi:hypothetical protein
MMDLSTDIDLSKLDVTNENDMRKYQVYVFRENIEGLKFLNDFMLREMSRALLACRGGNLDRVSDILANCMTEVEESPYNLHCL